MSNWMVITGAVVGVFLALLIGLNLYGALISTMGIPPSQPYSTGNYIVEAPGCTTQPQVTVVSVLPNGGVGAFSPTPAVAGAGCDQNSYQTGDYNAAVPGCSTQPQLTVTALAANGGIQTFATTPAVAGVGCTDGASITANIVPTEGLTNGIGAQATVTVASGVVTAVTAAAANTGTGAATVPAPLVNTAGVSNGVGAIAFLRIANSIVSAVVPSPVESGSGRSLLGDFIATEIIWRILPTVVLIGLLVAGGVVGAIVGRRANERFG